MCTLESRIDRGEGWIDRSRLKFLENPINEVSVLMWVENYSNHQ